jgi:2',3'-cyclic-nucleotide 2'-phosphodiesterase (5'-nucleotidase family)
MRQVDYRPGKIRLSRSTPNPNGAAGTRLYLISGAPPERPVEKIEWDTTIGTTEKQQIIDPAPSFPRLLKLIHFNDLHGRLTHCYQGQSDPVLARMSSAIKTARQSAEKGSETIVLLLTAGDDCSGSIYDEFLLPPDKEDIVHPSYHLYSDLGVDLAGLGNHDFDFGVSALIKSIRRDAHFPILAANLKACDALHSVCHLGAIIAAGSIRIGAIGLVTRAEVWAPEDQCLVINPVPVAQHLVHAIRPLCDVLILLTHLGISRDNPVPTADAGDRELAASLPTGSVDLIVGGHSHSILNLEHLESQNIVNGIPIVQAGSHGEYLGIVEIMVNGEEVEVQSGQLLPVKDLPIDWDFEDQFVAPLSKKALRQMDEYVGILEIPEGTSTLSISETFANSEMALANFLTDALVSRLNQIGVQADMAMIDSSVLHNFFPQSDTLRYGDCYQVMPYTDTIRIYRLKGKHLLDLLADNALRINQPEETHLERGFLQFSQEITYVIDPGTSRWESRLDSAKYNGTSLEKLKDKDFLIASSCFIRQLAAPWQETWQTDANLGLLDINQFPFEETDHLVRHLVIEAIRELGGVTPRTGFRLDGRMQLVSRPGKK